MKLSGTLLLTAGFAIAVSISTAGPAAAKPTLQAHVHESGSEVLEEFCGDLTVRHDFVVDVYNAANPHGPDGLVYFADRIRVTDSWTNLANNRTFTITFSGQQKDQEVTDNGDGTLTARVLGAGRQFTFGPDGNRFLFLDAGMFQFELLVDNGGTPTDPSDDSGFEFLGIVRDVGRVDTTNRDFCQDIHNIIG